MGLFEQWPYTNLHTLNLDWILQMLTKIDKTLDEFVAINALKYADPIQWNITSQYEKNTIVIDPQTGTAYISVQPVPVGVLISNTDYWSVVFNLEQFVTGANSNITVNVEADTTLNATFPTTQGHWLIWEGILYKALTNIIAGDQYVVGSNIIRFTIEDVVGHLDDLITTDKSNLVAAINELATEVLGKIGDLNDLNTTDKSNLVSAINEVLNNINTKVGELSDLTTTDQSNIVAAINELVTNISNITGDISNIQGTIATLSDIPVDVTKHGVVGDGVTDDTDAFRQCLSDFDYLYIPNGAKVVISDTITISRSVRIVGAGVWGAEIINNTTNTMFYLSARGVTIEDITFSSSDPDNNGITIDIRVGQGMINNCHFSGYNTAIRMNNTSMQTVSNCFFQFGSSSGAAITVGDTQYCSGITLSGIRVFGTDNDHPYCGIRLVYTDGVDVISCIINRCQYPIIISPTDSSFIHAVRFVQTLFDYNDYGVSISTPYTGEVFLVSFDACWFYSKNTQSDVIIQQTVGDIEGITINNCEFLSGFYGLNVRNTVKELTVNNCAFYNQVDGGINLNGEITAAFNNIFIGTAGNAMQPTVTPRLGVQIAGNFPNRMILINNLVSVEATQFDLFTSYRSGVLVTNSKINKGNFLLIGNDINKPTGADDGQMYFNTTTNKAMFMINGVLQTWPDQGATWQSGATAQRPATPVLGEMYYDTTVDAPIWYTSNGWTNPFSVKTGDVRYNSGNLQYWNGSSWINVTP